MYVARPNGMKAIYDQISHEPNLAINNGGEKTNKDTGANNTDLVLGLIPLHWQDSNRTKAALPLVLHPWLSVWPPCNCRDKQSAPSSSHLGVDGPIDRLGFITSLSSLGERNCPDAWHGELLVFQKTD